MRLMKVGWFLVAVDPAEVPGQQRCTSSWMAWRSGWLPLPAGCWATRCAVRS